MKHTVYIGINKRGLLVYVGTTIQPPADRFRWHKSNGKKNLTFFVIDQFDNAEQMLAREFELIDKFKPAMNKITKRPQNLNIKLDEETLASRKGNPEWCQCCLKRRVNKGYTVCYFCNKDALC